MSRLAEQAIAREGLAPILEARRARNVDAARALGHALETADLLAVGALADLVRDEEVGALVRVFVNVRPEAGTDAIEVHGEKGGDAAGMRFLRRVAIARITGPYAAPVRVDWSEVGLELAQVALGFGATELLGPIANKRGLTIADDAAKKVKGEGMVSLQRLKTQELAGLVQRSGRRVVIVGPRGIETEPVPPPHMPHEPTHEEEAHA